MKFKHGFSLTELLIVIAIIMILASMIAVNMDSYKQTAKQEAEKLAGYIHDLMRKADRSHRGFAINLETTQLRWQWASDNTSWKSTTDGILIYKKNPTGTEKPIISPGFTIEYKFSGKDGSPNLVKYGTDSQFNRNGHFTVINDKNTEDTKYFVNLRFGRVRASDKKEED